MAFHTAHKLQLLAHAPVSYRELGRLVADCKKVPQSIARAPRGAGHLGHHIEWVEMMKNGTPAYSNFEIAAYLNEVILLGVIAQNIGEGKPIGWDGPNMKATDNAEASKLVKRAYREGWEPKV